MEEERVVDLRPRPRPSLDYIELMMNTFLLHKFREAVDGDQGFFSDYRTIDSMHMN